MHPRDLELGYRMKTNFYGKHKFVTKADQTLTTTGTAEIINAISQGDTVETRSNDAIWLYGVSYKINVAFTPYTVGATAQQFTTSSAANDTNWLCLVTTKIPASGGSSDYSLTFSAANPPTNAGGGHISFATQASTTNVWVNPARANEFIIHKFWETPMIHSDRDFGNQIINSTQGSGSIAGTVPPSIFRREGYCKLGHAALYNNASSNCLKNILAFVFYSKFSTAQRNAGGYDHWISYTFKLHFADINS